MSHILRRVLGQIVITFLIMHITSELVRSRQKVRYQRYHITLVL
nr:MAG TPA: hypothetical protein [Caudoviricetes sp.]